MRQSAKLCEVTPISPSEYCNLSPAWGVLHHGQAQKALEAILNRYVLLYLATLIVLIPVDVLFLGMVARRFFTSEVGDMLRHRSRRSTMIYAKLDVEGLRSIAQPWPATGGTR